MTEEPIVDRHQIDFNWSSSVDPLMHDIVRINIFIQGRPGFLGIRYSGAF